jgi:acetyltransferase
VARSQLARFTQIDYDREMALVAVDETPAHAGRLLGEARAVVDPEDDSAEFAISVRSELAGQGLGRLLLERIVAHCRARGLRQLTAQMLVGNERMRRLALGLGFVSSGGAADGVARMRLALDGGARGAVP